MVEGVKQLTENLRRKVPGRIKAAAKRAMEKGADETVAMMKRSAPHLTGELRNSIGWTWGEAPAGSMVIGTVGNRDYATMRITIYAGNERTMVTNARGIKFQLARLQEFGTQNMPANSFFFPSWRAMKMRVRSRISREVRKAIKSGAASE